MSGVLSAGLRPPLALNRRRGYFRGACFSFFCASTAFFTFTASTPITLAAFAETVLAKRPLGSQPAAIEEILPPFSIKKFVGMVLVWNTFQASPLGSTA